MRKMVGFLAGVICGALVGGVTAILLAPYAGSELRDRIGFQAQGLIDKGRQAAEAKRIEMEAQFEAFRQGRPVVLQESGESAEG